MKLHNNWMTNNNLFSDDSYSYSNSVLLQELKEDFDRQRLHSLEGATVSIDNQSNIRVIIQEHLNPINEGKEDRLILIPNTIPVHRGSIVTWGEEKFMIMTDISPNDDNGVYVKGKMIKTVCELPWYDDYNNLNKQYVIDTNATLYSLGVTQGKITTVDGMLKLTLEDTEATKLIKRDKRFIYKNRFAYQVTFADLSVNGFVSLTLKEVDVNSTTDNLLLGIADYTNRPIYTIQIQEDDISIGHNISLQLHAIVAKDGVVVSEEVEWVSSDSSVATVSSNGLLKTISIGNCTISAKLKGNNDYFDTINCNVVESAPANNIDILIQGDDSIQWTVSKSYKAVKMQNGIEIPTNFIFTLDYMGNPQELCGLNIISGNECAITANSDQLTGDIRLIAVNVLNAQEYYIKPISIIGYW